MKISPSGLDLIKSFEGIRLNAYLDQVKVPTIGFGTTMYDNGEKVKLGDTITSERALELLQWAVDTKANRIAPLVKVELNQNQIDAILSLTYNIGVGGFASSTVLRLINKNPNNELIGDAFLLWDQGHINGEVVVLPGLRARRIKEADYYFKPIS